MRMNLRALLALTASVAPLLVAGCGGSGGGHSAGSATRTGSVQIVVKWPARTASRLIPDATQSVKVVVTDSAEASKTVVIPRPASASVVTASVEGLAAGQATIHATAQPAADGTGVALAAGQETATVTAGQVTVAPTLTLQTEINLITISPPTTVVGAGHTATFTASAQNAAGDTVLLTGSKLTWTVSNALATVTSPGNPVTFTAGTTQGPTVLTVKDNESGLQVSANVTIGSPNTGSTNIVVADRGNLWLVGLDAIPATSFTSGQIIDPNGPFSVSQDAAGHIYYSNDSDTIYRVNSLSDTSPVTFNTGQFSSSVYVDPASHIYYRFNDFTGTGIRRIDDISGAGLVTYYGPPGVSGSHFGFPGGITTDSTGRIYVVDTNINHRVVRIDDMTGANATTFGSFGSGVNQFNFPLAAGSNMIAVDNLNRIYVADYNNSRIVRIDDMSGTNWTTFTVPVSGTLSTKPNNIAVKNTGRANPDIYFSTQDSMYKMDDMAGTNLVRYSGAGTNKFINIGGFGLKP